MQKYTWIIEATTAFFSCTRRAAQQPRERKNIIKFLTISQGFGSLLIVGFVRTHHGPLGSKIKNNFQKVRKIPQHTITFYICRITIEFQHTIQQKEKCGSQLNFIIILGFGSGIWILFSSGSKSSPDSDPVFVERLDPDSEAEFCKSLRWISAGYLGDSRSSSKMSHFALKKKKKSA